MRLATDRVHVTVPATSANLGPGFDALGVALNIRDDISVRAIAGPTTVEITGHGEGEVPTDETHLVARAARRALEVVGAPLTGLELRCHNRIPHGRGLGSSAAAVIGGILAARGLISEPEALNDEVALHIATEFEGHPDNAAPALLGGFTIAWQIPDVGPRAVNIACRSDISPQVLIPRDQFATSRARQALPGLVSHEDAAFNAGRSALLVHALRHDPTLLFDATADRLHQGYRAPVMPETAAALTELRTRGVAAAISGAGPSILILHTPDGLDVADIVSNLWHIVSVDVDTDGGYVEGNV